MYNHIQLETDLWTPYICYVPLYLIYLEVITEVFQAVGTSSRAEMTVTPLEYNDERNLVQKIKQRYSMLGIN